jgi:hypothetical protein
MFEYHFTGAQRVAWGKTTCESNEFVYNCFGFSQTDSSTTDDDTIVRALISEAIALVDDTKKRSR